MMEFTISRVLMALCSLMIMAVAIGPFSSIYDQRLEQAGSNTVEEVANLFDAISIKGDNIGYLIHGYDLLPSSDYYLKINGNLITLCGEKGNYTAFTNFKIDSQGEVIICYDDIMMVTIQTEGDSQCYCLEKVSEIFTKASIRVSMSWASL